MNSPAVLRWNMDKRYLAALSDAGVPTVPTTWIEPACGRRGRRASTLPDGEFVVKPAISGGGFETARYRPDEHDEARAHIDAAARGGANGHGAALSAAVDAQGEAGLIFLGRPVQPRHPKGPLLRPGAAARSHLWENEQISAAIPSEAELTTAGGAGRGAGPARTRRPTPASTS